MRFRRLTCLLVVAFGALSLVTPAAAETNNEWVWVLRHEFDLNRTLVAFDQPPRVAVRTWWQLADPHRYDCAEPLEQKLYLQSGSQRGLGTLIWQGAARVGHVQPADQADHQTTTKLTR